jgi:glycyl-tRNA synthetase beta subunit
MARRLGYAGLSRARVADAPFFWRQSRSVRLTRDGQMLEVAAEAACA